MISLRATQIFRKFTCLKEQKNRFNTLFLETNFLVSLKDMFCEVLSKSLDTIIQSKFFSYGDYTVKKELATFPSPAGMSLTKLSLAGNT
jgi:hypothetical protein